MEERKLLEKELKTNCPLCEKKGLRAFRPFCSKRCKNIDLGHWFTGRYSIPGHDGEDSSSI